MFRFWWYEVGMCMYMEARMSSDLPGNVLREDNAVTFVLGWLIANDLPANVTWALGQVLAAKARIERMEREGEPTTTRA